MRARRYDIYFAEDGQVQSATPCGRQHWIPRREDELCIHPRRSVKWNPYNHVYQCHNCGQMIDEDEEQ